MFLSSAVSLIILQRKYTVRTNFLEGQEITGKMRAILIDWLCQVHHRFHLLQETLYLTVAIIDRFLQVWSFAFVNFNLCSHRKLVFRKKLIFQRRLLFHFLKMSVLVLSDKLKLLHTVQVAYTNNWEKSTFLLFRWNCESIFVTEWWYKVACHLRNMDIYASSKKHWFHY